jgi:hypothetical protein
MRELAAQNFERHAVLQRQGYRCGKESISPEMVEPCFAMVMKISPGGPSSYTPTVR